MLVSGCAQEGFRSQSGHQGGYVQDGISLVQTVVMNLKAEDFYKLVFSPDVFSYTGINSGCK